MLTSLLTELLQIINTQTTFILFLLAELAKLTAYSKKPQVTSIDSLDYQKLVVDNLPLIIELGKLDFRVLLQRHLDQTGKMIKPVLSVKHLKTIPIIATVEKDNFCLKSVTPTLTGKISFKKLILRCHHKRGKSFYSIVKCDSVNFLSIISRNIFLISFHRTF